MSLDVTALATRSWKLFIDKPVEHVVGGFLVVLLSTVSLGLLVGPLMVGWVRMCEKQRRGENIEVGDIFKGFDAFVGSLVALILYGLGVFFGMILLILPGLVLMVAWTFAFHYIALRGEGPAAALGSSFRLFKDKLNAVLTCVLLVIVVSIVGGASLVLGFVTGPLSIIFLTEAFAELTA